MLRCPLVAVVCVARRRGVSLPAGASVAVRVTVPAAGLYALRV